MNTYINTLTELTKKITDISERDERLVEVDVERRRSLEHLPPLTLRDLRLEGRPAGGLLEGALHHTYRGHIRGFAAY